MNFIAAGNLSSAICRYLEDNSAECPETCKFVAEVGTPDALQANKLRLGTYPFRGLKYDPDFIKELDSAMVECLEPVKDKIPTEKSSMANLHTLVQAWLPYPSQVLNVFARDFQDLHKLRVSEHKHHL